MKSVQIYEADWEKLQLIKLKTKEKAIADVITKLLRKVKS